MGDPVLDALLRDLVKLDALGGASWRLELFGDVPGDGLALAVGVGGEQDFVGFFAAAFSSERTFSLPGTTSYVS